MVITVSFLCVYLLIYAYHMVQPTSHLSLTQTRAVLLQELKAYSSANYYNHGDIFDIFNKGKHKFCKYTYLGLILNYYKQ